MYSSGIDRRDFFSRCGAKGAILTKSQLTLQDITTSEFISGVGLKATPAKSLTVNDTVNHA